MELVSVIMPTYNRAALIGDAIQSVLDQTYDRLDLLLIDDGSTDNTENIISQFNDPRLKYVRQENKGAAAARNHGLALRTGAYVAFIDSDDIWFPEKLELEIEVMKTLPEVGVVCSDFSSIDEAGNSERSHLRSYFSVLNDYGLRYEDVFNNILAKELARLDKAEKVYWGDIYETMLFGNIILTSTSLFRKEVFDKVGYFDTKYVTLEDYDFFLKVAKIFPVALIDKPLIRYRYNSIQLSGELFFGRLCENLIEIFKKNIESIRGSNLYKANKVKIRRRLGAYFAQYGYYYFAQENTTAAAKHCFQSIKLNPTLYRSYLYCLFCLLPIGFSKVIRKMKKLAG